MEKPVGVFVEAEKEGGDRFVLQRQGFIDVFDAGALPVAGVTMVEEFCQLQGATVYLLNQRGDFNDFEHRASLT